MGTFLYRRVVLFTTLRNFLTAEEKENVMQMLYRCSETAENIESLSSGYGTMNMRDLKK